MFFDSNDTDMGFQAAQPTNYANLPTIPLEGLNHYTTYGFWENIVYWSDTLESFWFQLASVEQIGMGGGLIAITMATRILFFPSSFFMNVVGYKEKSLQYYV